MDKDFAKSIDFINSQGSLDSFRDRNRQIMRFMSDLDLKGDILDIGERNYFTNILEDRFDVKIDNTIGDLDIELLTAQPRYDFIICSHVLEHLFNPLFCLEMIKRRMKPDSKLIIATPIKPNFLPWGRGHFHEFDQYRFKKLIERAGFKIIRFEQFSTYHFWNLKCYCGLRPFIRLFFKEQGYCICELK
jgi:SAM-dependent methyltransferase